MKKKKITDKAFEACRQKFITAQKEFSQMRKARELESFEEEAKKYIGKWVRYEIGGPDLIGYVFVAGKTHESKEQRSLDVVQINLNPEYTWIGFDALPWDIGRFDYYKVKVLNEKEVSALKAAIHTALRINLTILGTSSYFTENEK